MATALDCEILFDWFEYLDEVASDAGLTLPAGAVDAYNNALSEYDANNYDTAFSLADSAVESGRGDLTSRYGELKSVAEAKISDIAAQLTAAKAEGIDVSAFNKPFSYILAIHDGGEYMSSVYNSDALLDDLNNYISEVRAGNPVDPLSGTYNIPADTTDVFVIDEFHPEAVGWGVNRATETFVKDSIQSALDEAGYTQYTVLGVDHNPPRMIVYVYSPTGFVISGAVIVLAAVVSLIGGYWAYRTISDWLEDREYSKVEKHKADLSAEMDQWLADKVASGELSEDFAQSIMDKWSSQMENVSMPTGGWLDMIMKIAGIGIIGIILIELIGAMGE